MSKDKTEPVKMTDYERAIFAEELNQQVSSVVTEDVPNWNRAQAFEQHFAEQKTSSWSQSVYWTMWFGVPALSMACSALAVTLVMTLLQGQPSDNQALMAKIDEQVQQKVAIELSKQTNEKVEALVKLKLREFAAEQQVLLANYRADMSAEQQQNNLSLASYIIGASRQERNEDMQEFFKFINEQRQDEQLEQRMKFQQLEREISLQKLDYQAPTNSDSNTSKIINYKG
ncbi:hypothetical protein AADZ84_12150 [Colwelliaceae bacterium MEBiC 14330]